jgi:Fe-S oxidoreductase
MPKKKISLDIANLDNFEWDMSRCIKCKGCYWVEHTYMPGTKWMTRCPTATKYQFDSYGAYGKVRIGLAVKEGRLEWTDKLLELIYEDPLCGACDVGCKRNLDLEIELTLEALRVKAVKDGKGPMPAHKKVAGHIEREHNSFGAAHNQRKAWVTPDIEVAAKADVLYFAGCAASYKNTEIAKSIGKILNAARTPFMLMDDERCCGNTVYSVGMLDEARDIAKRNVEAVRDAKVKTLLTGCAECYRMWKVDYPKMMNIATEDLGFKVMHLVEFADEMVGNGSLKLSRPKNMRIAYHDSCSIGRLSDPWKPWEGERGRWGVVTPPLKRRRGDEGLYRQPRNILSAIPGLQLVEMPRARENAFCCGAGRGTATAFPGFASWAAKQRLEEVRDVGAKGLVTACPWCKDNFVRAAGTKGEATEIYDISELIADSIDS